MKLLELALIFGGVLLTLSLLVMPIIIHDAVIQSYNPYKYDLEESANKVNTLLSIFSALLFGTSLLSLILESRLKSSDYISSKRNQSHEPY